MTPRAVTPCVCRVSGRSGGALGLRPRRPHARDRVPARRVARRKALFRALVDDVVGLRDPLAFFGRAWRGFWLWNGGFGDAGHAPSPSVGAPSPHLATATACRK